MKTSALIPLTVALGLMLSPKSLALFGNGVGRIGLLFLAAILLVVIVQRFTALRYREIMERFPGPGSELQFLEKSFGSMPALLLPICSRVVFTICGSTVLVVTAGFVFNEVFVYWFPNFAFAFALLVFLFAINVFGERLAGRFQVFFVLLTFSGLIFLTIAGLLKTGHAPQIMNPSGFASLAQTLFLGLLIILGFDLAAFSLEEHYPNPANLGKSMVAAILLAAIILALWGLVSLMHVQPETLATSTIPYTLAAKKILGQPGRIIAGLIIIGGVCCAVNALFMAVPKAILTTAFQVLNPKVPGNVNRKHQAMVLLSMAGGIAAMMVSGMAGNPDLEVYIKGALLIWLLHYASIHLAAITTIWRTTHENEKDPDKGRMASSLFSLVFLTSGFVALLWTEEESLLLLKFMLAVVVITLILGRLWLMFRAGKLAKDPDKKTR